MAGARLTPFHPYQLLRLALSPISPQPRQQPVPQPASLPEIRDTAQDAIDVARPGIASSQPLYSDEWLAEQEALYQQTLGPLRHVADTNKSPTLPKHSRGPVSGLEAVLLGVGDSAAFGFLDEAGAVADAVLGGPEGTENIWTSNRKWSEILNKNIRHNRERLEAARDEQSGAFIAGNIAGGVVPISRVGKLATGAADLSRTGRVGRAAAEGAMYGGLYGLGSDEGRLTDRLDGAAVGSAIGSVAGPAMYGAVKAGGRAVRPAIHTLGVWSQHVMVGLNDKCVWF